MIELDPQRALDAVEERAEWRDRQRTQELRNEDPHGMPFAVQPSRGLSGLSARRAPADDPDLGALGAERPHELRTALARQSLELGVAPLVHPGVHRGLDVGSPVSTCSRPLIVCSPPGCPGMAIGDTSPSSVR